jgi:hypothetical protein
MPHRLAWAGALLVLLILGCGDERNASGEAPSASLDDAERARLTAFVEEIRRAYEAGDARAVEARINREGTPDFFTQMTRRKSLPKGPMKVLDARVESRERRSPMVVRFGDVDYGFNVDPLGALVIEMDDVSIGRVKVELIIGRKGGRFFIAGLEPLE